MKKRRLFRTMKLIARQQNTSYSGDGLDPASVPNTSAFRGFYKLEFGQDWDINAPTYVVCDMAIISGIPVDLATGNQLPVSFAIRSNSLSGSGNIEEAKRWRRNITTAAGAVASYGLNPNNQKDPNIEVSTSNLLAIIPNTMALNYEYQADQPDPETFNTGSSYKLIYENPAEITTCGIRIPVSSAQSVIDVFITASYDYPQMNTEGDALDTRLQLVSYFDRQPLVAQGMVGGSWLVSLIFYQLADSPN